MTNGAEALDRENLLKELLLDLSVDMTGVVGTFVASIIGFSPNSATGTCART